MNFVHFRIFTLLSKDFQKEYNNHENSISELETGIWHWKLEIEQKHKLEVVHNIKYEILRDYIHSHFFISLIVPLTLKLKNIFIYLIK